MGIIHILLNYQFRDLAHPQESHVNRTTGSLIISHLIAIFDIQGILCIEDIV